tara:strand:- start:2326 stop:2763 length:438 start_codon:yes stop_codon:yes gene_type:complete
MTRIDSTTPDDWNAGDVNTTFANVTVTAGARILIGEFDAPQGTKATIGGAKGFLELFDDTTTAVREAGKLIFTAVNNSTGAEKEIYTLSTEIAGPSGQSAVPSEQYFFPVGAIAGDKIRMYFVSDATDTLDSSDHTWNVPVTILG